MKNLRENIDKMPHKYYSVESQQDPMLQVLQGAL